MTEPVSSLSFTPISSSATSTITPLLAKIGSVAAANWPLIAAVAALCVIGTIIYFIATRHKESFTAQDKNLADIYPLLRNNGIIDIPHEELPSIEEKAHYVR